MHHRICFVIAALSLVFATSVRASCFKGQSAYIGVNVSNFVGDAATAANTQSVTGLALGGALAFDLSDDTSIQIELMYSQKGAEFDSTLLGATEIHLDYLEFPVLFRYDPLKDKRVSPTILLGGAMGLRINASGTVLSNGMPLTGGGLEQQTNSVDFGLIAGLQVNVAVGSGEIFLQARIERGLVNVNEGGSEGFKNTAVSIVAGYFFPDND